MILLELIVPDLVFDPFWDRLIGVFNRKWPGNEPEING